MWSRIVSGLLVGVPTEFVGKLEASQLDGTQRNATRLSTLHLPEFPCLGAVTSRGDLRHLAKLFRHRPDQADFAADQGDLPFVERTGVEGHQKDRLMDRDAFVEIMEEGQDRAKVVVAHEVLEAVQEDGRTFARHNEMFV